MREARVWSQSTAQLDFWKEWLQGETRGEGKR